MSYSNRDATSPWLNFQGKASALQSARQSISKRRGLITTREWSNRKHYLFCSDCIYFALLEERQDVLTGYEHTWSSFGKQNYCGKYVAVNKPLRFVITQPTPEPSKAHTLWQHLAQSDSFSSWLSKRGKKYSIKEQKGTNPKIAALLSVLALNLTAVILAGKTTQRLSSFLQQW